MFWFVLVRSPPANMLLPDDKAAARQTNFNLFILTTFKKLVAKVYILLRFTYFRPFVLTYLSNRGTHSCTKCGVCAKNDESLRHSRTAATHQLTWYRHGTPAATLRHGRSSLPSRPWQNLFAKRPISHCKTAHFMAQNGPFHDAKWAVLQVALNTLVIKVLQNRYIFREYWHHITWWNICNNHIRPNR